MKILTRKTAVLLTTSAFALVLPSIASAQSATTVKFGGFIKAVGSFSQYSAGEPGSSAAIRDFYAGHTIPTSALSVKDYNAFTSNVKQSRLTAAMTTDIAGHTVKAYAEADFQAGLASGSQTATNAYNPALRRAFVTFDNWTVGQDWTTFQNTAVLPESTDYAGALDGTVFVRQPLVRYTHKISPNASLMVAAENPETTISGTAQDDDKMPDLVARLALKNGIGEFSVAGLVRQLNTVTGVTNADATGAGVSVSGVIPFGEKKASKLTFMVTHGEGIGRYVAAAATTDAVLVSGKLETPTTTNGLVSAKFALSPMARVNVMAGYHNADYPSAVAATGLTKTLKSVAVNYFYSPVKNVDFGIEFRHAEHERFGGASGDLNRVELAARYSF